MLLKTKLATWRYQRACKPISLVSVNTANVVTETVHEDTNEEMTITESEDQDVPPIIEDILEYLIQGLRDKTITIRSFFFIFVTLFYQLIKKKLEIKNFLFIKF